MNSISLYFDSPWLLLIAIPALAVILVPFFLLPAKRRKTFKKIAPAVLHSVVVVALVLILAGFSVVKKSNDQAVLLLVDLSDSTADVQTEIVAHTEELLSLMDDNTPVGVILFGVNRIYAAELEENSRSFVVKPVEADGTDLSAAMEYAATLLPPEKASHLILLSDGKETDGNAIATAHYLAARGVRMDAVYFDTTAMESSEMQIGSFSGSTGAYVDDELAFEVAVKSNTSSSAQLLLFDNDNLTDIQDVEVAEGTNLFTLKTIAAEPGTHAYRVELQTASDTISQNNTAYAYVKVTGEPSVLIIADTLSHANTLKGVLEAENYVTVVTAQNAPKSIVDLCNYDEVILVNVDENDLPAESDTLLETYVKIYGRSLLVTGGGETLMYGNMAETKMEELLPVTLSLTEDAEGNSTALMLVLDCSSSMSMQSTYLSVAKQGAIKCVEALSNNDYVGVVSFNSGAYLKSNLIRSTDANKESVTRIISGLTTARGTYYTQALQLAVQQLEQSDAPVKHIIFLSDGQPSDYGYRQVAQTAAAEGITISAIGLGYSSSILSSLAESAGGRYYYVSRATDLPDIMQSETEQVTVSSLFIGKFASTVAVESDLTAYIGTQEIPLLTGYLGTTLKEDATAYLVTGENENPIYAAWKCGNGTVACFTSDVYGDWSKAWLESDIGRQLILQTVATTVDEIHHDSTLTADIAVRGNTTDITVTTMQESIEHSIQIAVAHGQESVQYTLAQVSPGTYEISIPSDGMGIYELVVMETDGDMNAVDYLETAYAVSYSAEYDAFYEGGKAILEEICRYSDGEIFSDMQKLADVEMDSIEILYNPLILFSVISLILMLADIAIRKIRWKDLRAYFLTRKHRLSSR